MSDQPPDDLAPEARRPGDRLMSVAEVAEFCSIHRAGVYRLMNRGELPYVLVGHLRRVRRRDLLDYLERAS
jgi:excisionase family DNA binding protein